MYLPVLYSATDFLGTYITNSPADIFIGIIICLLLAVVVPVINIFSANFKKPVVDTLHGEEIVLTEKNQLGLERAVLKGDIICLKRTQNVRRIVLDVFFFRGAKSKRVHYTVNFENDYATIEHEDRFDGVKIIVLNVDGKVANKKVYGYPNAIFTIVASVCVALGIGLGVFVPAISFSKTFLNIYDAGYSFYLLNDGPEYFIMFYVVPFVIGVIAGILHFVLVKAITNSFNKGAK